MKKSILSLEGVIVLSKREQKSVNGGLRNCTLNGQHRFLTSYDTYTDSYVNVSQACGWTCDTTFLGIKVGTREVWGGCSVWG
jgi:hypothetical protein